MSKLQDIRNLVQEHAVSVSSSPGDWMDYMDTASRLYRYSFSDQLLIHAQRPDATACASAIAFTTVAGPLLPSPIA